MTKFSVENVEHEFFVKGEWEVSAGLHLVACGPTGVANALRHLFASHAPLGETELCEIVAVIRKVGPDQHSGVFEDMSDPSRN